MVRVVPEQTRTRHLEFVEESAAGGSSADQLSWGWSSSVLRNIRTIRVVLQLDAVPMNAQLIRKLVDYTNDHRVIDVELKGRSWDPAVEDLSVRRYATADVDWLNRGR
jgi:hypothetical protein